MGSARDSSPDPNRATVSARPPLPERARPLPSASSAPATRPRPPGPLSKSEARGSPPIPVPAGVRPLDRQPKLLDRLREALRARHYSPRTEQTYCQWVKRFIFFHHVRHPAEMGEAEINAFLTHLAVQGEGERLDAEPGPQRAALPVPPRPRSPTRGPGRGRPGSQTAPVCPWS